MTAVLILASLTAALAVGLAQAPPAGWRGRVPHRRPVTAPHGDPDGPGPPTAEGPMRWSRPAAGVAGLAVLLIIGGWVGAVAGVATALVLPVLVGRLEPARVRRERLELTKVAPIVADLLAAALSAGVPDEQALGAIAHAVGGSGGRLLVSIQRRIQLGEAPEQAWGALGSHHALSGISRSVARSARTGAPVAALLALEAGELRARAASAALGEVRAASVRAVLPLGLCLLPAFGLLGVVPVVASLIPSL